MRVLIYGFGPYGQFKDNITQHIVNTLPRSANLKKIVFPVRFNKQQFPDSVKRFRPDVVVGLGQCSRGRQLRIERRAVNKRRSHKKENARSIVRGGPVSLPTTLNLQKFADGKQARISKDAGDYVCNFSMYVILHYLRHHRRDARFGFVHVPHDYNPERAVKFVRKILRSLGL